MKKLPQALMGLLVSCLGVPAMVWADAGATPPSVYIPTRSPEFVTADYLRAAAPGCAVSNEANPVSGFDNFTLRCGDTTLEINSRYVKRRHLDSFRNLVKAELFRASPEDAKVPGGGFSREHSIHLKLDESTQVIFVLLRQGYDSQGQARSIVRALARDAHGFIYADHAAYSADGALLVGDPAASPGRF